MKLYVICALIIVFLAVLSYLNLQFVTDIVFTTCEDLQNSVALYQEGDTEACLNLLRNTEQDWQSKDIILGSILPHSEIDTVLISFAELISRVKCDDSDDFYSTAASLMIQLEHMQDIQHPLPQNIF